MQRLGFQYAGVGRNPNGLGPGQAVWLPIVGNTRDVSATETPERIAICHRRPVSLQFAQLIGGNGL